ncbi:flagellin [Litoreibacter sp.]|nr:flagellin [Litoreibacter sp.]
MNVNGVGDLATSLLARRNNADLKHEFVRLTQELATGRKSDISNSTGGNTSSLASLEHSLTLIDAFTKSESVLSQKLAHAEIALSAIGDDIAGIGQSILANADSGGIANNALLVDASSSFQTALSALSVRIGGAYVFSGVALETPPLADEASLLSSLQTATSGALTAADFYQRVDDWFSQSGGFDVAGYTGGDQPTRGVRVSATDEARFKFTAESPEIRAVLRDLSVFALVEQGDFLGSQEELTELTKIAASGLIAGETELIGVRSDMGKQQERVTAANAQNSFQMNSLTEMRNEVVGVDLYETAARFEEIQLQLESLYLVTAKTARLSLTEYLR